MRCHLGLAGRQLLAPASLVELALDISLRPRGVDVLLPLTYKENGMLHQQAANPAKEERTQHRKTGREGWGDDV